MTFFGVLALAGVVTVAFVPRTVGGMAFEEVRRERGVVVFQQGDHLHSLYGYAWSPQGEPARLLEDVEWSEDHVDHYFEHLRGAFYS
ncbi:hypothetical protein ACI2LC_25520 [Nonomuraea wenchangensis]|uniref:hypothetical protein n=1 Tax=Nonomuraea wenchangensis TaxID=568860 RepID=UPI003401F097